MQQTNLTIYGAPWCGDCRRAKRFLDERGVPYTWVEGRLATQVHAARGKASRQA